MTRHEAIETLLNSRFEAWRIIPAMVRVLFERRYPDKAVLRDRNAIISVIVNRLSDDQVRKLAQTFGRDPHPPIKLRQPKTRTQADLERAKTPVE